uniref:Uncharacterized protein n=1 Tax=viral metagenome TaxID=1070528 RepID=A0A6C0IFZ8_9ZZZZ
MSYYILPKVINSYIKINPSSQENVIDTYISHSLFNYYKKMKTQLNTIIEDDSSFNIQNIVKIVNPYEFIFSKIPGSNLSVSKVKTQTSIFYDMLEIIHMLNIFDNYRNTNINFITISSTYEDVNCCYELFRENNNDSIDNYTEFKSNLHEELNRKSYDIIFYEIEKIVYCNLNNYIIKLIDTILLILHRQKENGITIIKVGFTFHKPVVDILYLLSSLYQKVYIVKPNTSNVMSYEKFIVCKNFILNDNTSEIYFSHIVKLIEFKKFYSNNENIKHIIDKDTPYFYINKIDDINNIIGQQQLETIDQVINIYKNKNKDDKIESLKKINIHKSINWCEKMKIPYNKFSEKPNIFLPIINTNTEKEDYYLENEVIEEEILCIIIEEEI